ncbi:MAG TPA: hypothetical protein VFO16_13500 [Pseudonocardiaceae bacterium]|nr:hypothetical protein [Pseudonocardiaceae bacterium]
MTTIRISTKTRDRLAGLAREDFGGISQEAALHRLIDEHEMRQVHAAYARLRDDPVEWEDYQRELALTGSASGDGLGHPRDEYPEYNQ